MVPEHWWCWKGNRGHLVIMTLSLSPYCLCIISSIRAAIIDSPLMLMLWIWSVDGQILSHVVFWAWHLRKGMSTVWDSSQIAEWLQLSLGDSLDKSNQAALTTAIYKGWGSQKDFFLSLFGELNYYVASYRGQLDLAHAHTAFPVNPHTHLQGCRTAPTRSNRDSLAYNVTKNV